MFLIFGKGIKGFDTVVMVGLEQGLDLSMEDARVIRRLSQGRLNKILGESFFLLSALNNWKFHLKSS